MSNNISSPFFFGRSGDIEEELIDKIYQALSGQVGTNQSTNVMNQQQIPGPFLFGPHLNRKAELLDKILQAVLAGNNGNGQGGCCSVFQITSDVPQYLVPQNRVIEYLVATSEVEDFIQIGTTPGGNELFEGYTTPGQPSLGTIFFPFTVETEIYVTGMSAGTVLKFKTFDLDCSNGDNGGGGGGPIEMDAILSVFPEDDGNGNIRLGVNVTNGVTLDVLTINATIQASSDIACGNNIATYEALCVLNEGNANANSGSLGVTGLAQSLKITSLEINGFPINQNNQILIIGGHHYKFYGFEVCGGL